MHFSHWSEEKKERKLIKLFKKCGPVFGTWQKRLTGDSHGRASLRCGYAGGSSVSAGVGSAFHRSRMDMASRPCGLAHGHGDEQPMEEKKVITRKLKSTAPADAEQNKFRLRIVLGRVVTCTNRAPHVSHLYGFSPEWMRV